MKKLTAELVELLDTIRENGLESVAKELSPYAYESVVNFVNHGVIRGRVDAGDPGQIEVSIGLCSALRDPMLWAISDPKWVEFAMNWASRRTRLTALCARDD